VIARGRVVARRGRVTVPIPPPELSAEVLPGPRILRPLAPNDLCIPAPPGRDRVRVRVIRFTGELVTQTEVRELPARGGALVADPESDLLKVVVLDCRGQGRIARGFVSGYGLRRGALASSLSFDTANLILLGASDADMLVAAERMLALRGGFVVAADGTIRAEVPLPLGGIISDQPMEILAGHITGCQRALAELGCASGNPFLGAQVLTFLAIPALRIRERGLWDVRQNRVVPLILEGDE
jgi:adenine deaminase